MLPQPLRGILVGVICTSVVVMIASGASRFGSEEPESWDVFFVGLTLFIGALVSRSCPRSSSLRAAASGPASGSNQPRPASTCA